MNIWCKEAALYLATRGVRKPTQIEWKNAVWIVSARKQKKLTVRETGEAVMDAQYKFENGIDDEFLIKELPPPPTSEQIIKERKDARRKKSTRSKQVR
jgi:hypothetical protein